MKSLFERGQAIIEYLENTPISLATWIISFAAVVGVRFFIEVLIAGQPYKDLDEFVGSLVHGTLVFFLLSYLVLLVFLKIVTKEQTKKIANILLWGQWLILLPPIVDKIIFGDKQYWSFYVFDNVLGVMIRFFQFFGENPSFGITWGTRTMVAIAETALETNKNFFKRNGYWE